MLTFHINTAHRSSGNSGDATFDLSAPIVLKAGQKLILDTARFPLSWYNFRGKACNWKINYNSAEEAGAIEPGFYTIAGAATRLVETLRAVIPAATFTVDYALPVTGKLTITSVDDEWYDVIFQEGRLSIAWVLQPTSWVSLLTTFPTFPMMDGIPISSFTLRAFPTT